MATDVQMTFPDPMAHLSQGLDQGYTHDNADISKGLQLIDVRRQTVLTNLVPSILVGLRSKERELPGLLLWDDRGLSLFDAVLESPDYYPLTREWSLLCTAVHEIVSSIQSGDRLIELGAGNMKKTALILRTLQSQGKSITYIACDVDRVALQRGMRHLQSLFPPSSSGIRIQGLVATYEDCVSWLQNGPNPKPNGSTNGSGSRTTLMWIGNSLANYPSSVAANYIRSFLSTGASLIVGIDGNQDEAEIARAYEGAANRDFVLNGLAHANELLGSQVFDPRDWTFRGRMNRELSMHESFYVAERDLTLTVRGERFEFKRGGVLRSIRSGKWPRSKMVSICEEAGAEVAGCWLAEKESYAAVREYSWFLLDRPNHGQAWQSVDVLIREDYASQTSGVLADAEDIHIYQLRKDEPPAVITESSLGAAPARGFLWEALRAASVSGERAVKLIVPLNSGYVVRSNIIPLRLRDSQHVESAISFAQPLQTYDGQPVSVSSCTDLTNLIPAAIAGLILHPNCTPGSKLVESDLEDRLSFPWIQPGCPRRKTLALVDANSAHPEEGLGFYRAARELGVNVVVLDNAGHWLEDPAQSHWRKAFLPTRLTNPPEPDVGSHIMASLRAYGKPIDGIVTFADSFWYYIAQIAPELGLQTAPPESLCIATNKFLTSKYVGHEAYSATSLDEALTIADKIDLPYPLIVKPCDGWSSEGVSRVDGPDALPAAIKSIDASRHGAEFVMERYCSGPEVDVNLVLLDGKILFAEVCDDLPKSADMNGPTVGSLTNFHELNSVYPSALPEKEVDLLITSFVDTLLSLGIRNGVMHLEGRVENSTQEYRETDGIIDLHSRSKDPSSLSKQPSAWLIEINPRPLGMTGSHIIESTYGIDYWALAVVLGVNDKARARALSIPYQSGPQYTAIMVFIPADFPVECEGIFDSDDICADLIARRPDLGKSISRCATLVKRGEKVKHPSTGKHTFLAYFNVFSRLGRDEALKLASEVREEVRYSFV